MTGCVEFAPTGARTSKRKASRSPLRGWRGGLKVYPMLARGSQSHDQHGENRHGLPGYVFPRSHAIRPRSASPLPTSRPGRPSGSCRPSGRSLAVQVLAGTHPVAELARQHQVSRKFLYQQADTATHALTRAFDPAPDGRRRPLLTCRSPRPGCGNWSWLWCLIGHSPYRAVVELLRDLFDWKHLPGYGPQHRPQRRRTGAGHQPTLRPGRRSHRGPR